MKVVITGHNSLIGSNLAKYFSLNNNVILLGTRKNIYEKYLFHYKYKYLDLNNLNAFFKNEKNIDLFIHCAGINAKVCELDAKHAFDFNVKLNGIFFAFRYLQHKKISDLIGVPEITRLPLNKSLRSSSQ